MDPDLRLIYYIWLTELDLKKDVDAMWRYVCMHETFKNHNVEPTKETITEVLLENLNDRP